MKDPNKIHKKFWKEKPETTAYMMKLLSGLFVPCVSTSFWEVLHQCRLFKWTTLKVAFILGYSHLTSSVQPCRADKSLSKDSRLFKRIIFDLRSSMASDIRILGRHLSPATGKRFCFKFSLFKNLGRISSIPKLSRLWIIEAAAYHKLSHLLSETILNCSLKHPCLHISRLLHDVDPGRSMSR